MNRWPALRPLDALRPWGAWELLEHRLARLGMALPCDRGKARLLAMEPCEEQLGTIPLSALVGRSSRSAEAALRKQIETELAMTPLERVLLSIRLGAQAKGRHPAGGSEP